MKKIVVNGDFFCRSRTGIERCAYETLLSLDKIISKGTMQIFVPANARNVPEYENIEVVRSPEELHGVTSWSLKNYRKHLSKTGGIGFDFANTTCLFKPGISFIHDIYCKLYPEDFKGLKSRLICWYSRFLYWFVAHFAKLIFTDSENSRQQIIKIYHAKAEKVKVVPMGWDHFLSVKEDLGIFEKHPELKDDFFFTLGSLAKRKNLKWIAKYASEHPEQRFAISGKIFSDVAPEELKKMQDMNNITVLGYISDEEVKALMKKCRAFVFPSYYEGFGIPPLEALSCGAEIVVADSSCLPEIYGKSARYIDPNDTNVNLEELLKEEVSSAEPVLEKFTYRNAAAMILSELEKFALAGKC